MGMKTTVDIDSQLLAEAAAYCGIKQKRQLIHAALRSLIAAGAAARLAEIGGSEPTYGRMKRDAKTKRRRSDVGG